MVLDLFSLGSFLLYWKNYNFFVLVSEAAAIAVCVHARALVCMHMY